MKITGRSRQNLSILPNEVSFITSSDFNVCPDVYCELVGTMDLDGNITKSLFKTESEEPFEKVKFLVDNDYVIKKHRVTRNFEEGLKEVIMLYYPYDIQESTKFVPTYTDERIESAYVMNGHYHATYEVIFAADEYTLRLPIQHYAVNVPMFDWIEDIRTYATDVIEEYEDMDENNPFINLIKVEDGVTQLFMFDDLGRNEWIEFEGINELMSMIVSIRLIGCEFIKSEN